jgi:hypothetical protein
MLKKKIWASFQRIVELFTQKFVSSLKYGFGSGIRKEPIPDPGSVSRGQKGTGSRIWIRNTGIFSWSIVLFSTNQFFVIGGEEQVRPVRLGPPN